MLVGMLHGSNSKYTTWLQGRTAFTAQGLMQWCTLYQQVVVAGTM